MSRIAVKGRCPGAHRPMTAGDGLIVRVRPMLGRLTTPQALGLCDAANRFGSGMIELTRRANLQLRGVTEATFAPLLETLGALNLLDDDPAVEERRNILVAPLWSLGDATERIASELVARLPELPALPAKFGFAVDAGAGPMLAAASADVRIERGASGGLIVRADGAATGRPVSHAEAADAALEMARWFVAHGGAVAGRMGRLGGPEGAERPAAALPELAPGASAIGPVLGAPFGQLDAAALTRLVEDSDARAVRMSPWRLILLEGGRAVEAPGFVADPGDPALKADACAGAPFCVSASVETRGLARTLAGLVAGGLHVSGCPKGCARTGPAAITLVGRDGLYDLVRDGGPADAPVATGLTRAAVLARFGSGHAPRL